MFAGTNEVTTTQIMFAALLLSFILHLQCKLHLNLH